LPCKCLFLLVCACVLHKTYSKASRVADLRMEITDITMKMYFNCYLVSGSARINRKPFSFIYFFQCMAFVKYFMYSAVWYLKTNDLSPAVLFLRLVN